MVEMDFTNVYTNISNAVQCWICAKGMVYCSIDILIFQPNDRHYDFGDDL